APGGDAGWGWEEERRRKRRESRPGPAPRRRRRSPSQRSARPKTRRAAAAGAPRPRARRAGSRDRGPGPRRRAPPAGGHDRKGRARRPPRSLLARRQVQIGRQRLRQLPSDVRLVPQLVIRVGGLDRLVEERLERREVLAGERVLDRLPFLGEELVQVVIVLRSSEGSEITMPAHLIQLVLSERRVFGTRRV